MIPYRPERILLEAGSEGSPIAQSVLRSLPDVPVEPIESADERVDEYRQAGDGIAGAKRLLVLARQKGRFFRACQGQNSRTGTRNVCCDYFVINFASNCHLECTYCFLQSYLTFPYLIVYTNVDDLLRELDMAFASEPDRVFRVGTGELSDSLALDPLTGYSRYLVEFFADRPNALLELKTKTDCIENLLVLEHRRRTVVAWSVNPPAIQHREELKTATLDRRLAAARRCTEAGYPVAFHFDPMVHFAGWEEAYHQVIDQIFAAVRPESVAWISLGGLRMPAAQRDLMVERFPHSRLPQGELVPAEDGKLRYFKPIRVDLYRSLLARIRERAPSVKVYACMERPEVWRKVFGYVPEDNRELGDELGRFEI
ncbi:MAG: spore photoproduct lyase family protein [Acidobacteriota bacterium]